MCLSSKPVSAEGSSESVPGQDRGGGGLLTSWVERDHALQELLQLGLQAAEADAAALFQSHQRLDAPAHVHGRLLRALLPDERAEASLWGFQPEKLDSGRNH